MNRKLSVEEEEEFFFAIKENKADLLEHLLKRNINVNHIFYGCSLAKSYWTGLHLCCENGSYECCMVLLKSGADPNYSDKNGQTPLMYSTSAGWRNITELLLQYGADTHVQDITGSTVVHIASSCDDERIIQILLESDVDINKEDAMGSTPLWLAASNEVGISILDKILKHTNKDRVNLCDSRKKRNALQAAILNTSQDMFQKVQALTENNCDICNIDYRFHTPIMNIMQRWYESSAKGRLTSAIKDDLIRCYKLILKNGYNVNYATCGTRIFDHDGSVLHLVAKLGLAEMVEMLVHSDANVNQINKKSLTPLHIAADHGHTDVVKSLLQHGSNISHASYFAFHLLGNKLIYGTSFRLALESGRLETALFLIDAGYDLHLESYLIDEINMPDMLYQSDKVFQFLKNRKLARENNVTDSLLDLCIKVIRYCLASKLQNHARALPLPNYLKDLIQLKGTI